MRTLDFRVVHKQKPALFFRFTLRMLHLLSLGEIPLDVIHRDPDEEMVLGGPSGRRYRGSGSGGGGALMNRGDRRPVSRRLLSPPPGVTTVNVFFTPASAKRRAETEAAALARRAEARTRASAAATCGRRSRFGQRSLLDEEGDVRESEELLRRGKEGVFDVG